MAERREDSKETEAAEQLKGFFDENRSQVFFSRQIEVLHEGRYFHWITNRALNRLIAIKDLKIEQRTLNYGGAINLLWHRSYRHYKRSAERVVKLVEGYSSPVVGEELGRHGEVLTLQGFAEAQFTLRGRNINVFQKKRWPLTDHNLDFIFEKDGIAYGIEVKNTLRYIDQREFRTKTQLCQYLGLRPVFVVRMIPRTWVQELVREGGFALILKYQLYPPALKSLTEQIIKDLRLPVGTPRKLEEGTMSRFLRWHTKNV